MDPDAPADLFEYSIRNMTHRFQWGGGRSKRQSNLQEPNDYMIHPKDHSVVSQ